jgi:hypothetical protein
MRKRLIVVFATGLFSLALASPAVAQTTPYPPGGSGISVSSSTVGPGGTITATVTGMPPNTLVTFTFQSAPVVVGTAMSDASGTATLTFTIPAGIAPGVHTISASGGGVTKTITITVTGPSVPAGGGSIRAKTGFDLARPLGIALVLLIVGGATIVLARRRSRV